MDLEMDIWRGVSQKEKNKYHILTYICRNLEKIVQMNISTKQK